MRKVLRWPVQAWLRHRSPSLSREGVGVDTEAGILALSDEITVAGQRRTLPASPIAALASVLWATSVLQHIRL